MSHAANVNRVPAVSQHPMNAQVLSSEIRRDLLSLECSGKKGQQLHKHIQQGMNKAPDTLAVMLTESQSDPTELAQTIIGFFRAHSNAFARSLPELMPLETEIEGRFNCDQMAVAQGDLSPARLKAIKADAQGDLSPARLKAIKADIALYRPLLDEMETAVDRAIYVTARGASVGGTTR